MNTDGTLSLIWIMLFLYGLVQFAWSSRSEGLARFVGPGLCLVVAAVTAFFLSRSGTRPDGDWWTAVVALTVLALHYALDGLRAHRTGVALLVGSGTQWPGARTAGQARRRLDRVLRTAGTAPRPSHGTEPGEVGPVLSAAARAAGAGDLPGAVAALDAHLQQWRRQDGVLALALYHRVVYAALAARDGTPLDTPRVRGDLDLARTLLPDPRLGWLADAALAKAEGGRWAGAWSAERVRRFARGPWEAGLAALLLAGDDGESHETVAARYPWLAGLARRTATARTAP